MMNSGYVLGNLEREIKRLELQASLFAPISIRALHDAGIRKGMRCVDVGCGSGSVSRAMGEIVGKTGKVVGIDVDEKYLDYCRSVNRHPHVEFARDDISHSSLDEDGRFDIVFSRFLFVHLRDKRSALRSMMRLLKAGGKVIIQELDHAPGSWLCHPSDKNVDALRRAYVALLKTTGGDPLAGRKLYPLLVQEAKEVQVSCFSPCLRMGYDPYSTLGWRIMDSLRPQLLKNKILSRSEFERMHKGLKSLAKKKDAFVTYARFFSVTGRR